MHAVPLMDVPFATKQQHLAQSLVITKLAVPTQKVYKYWEHKKARTQRAFYLDIFWLRHSQNMIATIHPDNFPRRTGTCVGN